MAGSADEIGAPDSWEMADLDERMNQLVILSSKKTSEVPSSCSNSSVDRSGGMPGEAALNQVDQFLRDALEKPRERLSILRMERDVEKFLRDRNQQQLEFRALPTSYLRLAAHRMAQHYCLQSLAVPDNSLPDGSGSRIVLYKTSESRFPLIRLADIPVNLPLEDVNNGIKVAIKQRPQKSSQNISNSNAHSAKNSHQKSVEERKEEYNRARTRIFSSSSGNSGGTVGKVESNSFLEDSFQYCSMTMARPAERFSFEGLENNIERGLSDSASGSSRTNRMKSDKEPAASRYEANTRVAIFRDREVERKDPDYDRSYDRYMQRFDPGFGFSRTPYPVHPLFSPAVNYNTEFPQLGTAHRGQISVEQLPRASPQRMHSSWPVPPVTTAVGYGPDGTMASFNPTHGGSHPTSAVYVHPSQYSVPLRPGISFVHPSEHLQNFPQTYQQQSEASFALARPR